MWSYGGSHFMGTHNFSRPQSILQTPFSPQRLATRPCEWPAPHHFGRRGLDDVDGRSSLNYDSFTMLYA